MKSLKFIGFAVIAAAMLLGFASCGNNAGGTPTPEEPPHEHTFATEWSSDATHHWHVATCEHTDEVSGKAEHTWNEGTVTTEPTCAVEGVRTYTCTVCEAEKTEPAPKVPHTLVGDLTVDSATGIGTKKCSVCNSDGLVGPVLKAGGYDSSTGTYGGDFKKALKDNLGVKADYNSSTYSIDANVTKVVFALLSDAAIKAKVSTLTNKTDIGAVDGTCYAYAEPDDENLIIYIVPADENAMGFIFNEDSNYMFYQFANCTEIEGLVLADTSNVTNMRGMFEDCSELTALDVSNFDTSNVTDMSYMFYDCSGLTALDVGDFDTSNVMGMRSMFYGCSGLTALDLSGFNTSKVTGMGDMFSGCSGLTVLDVSGFDTSKVTGMGDMFYYCEGLTALDVSGFNTSNVTDMSCMFQYCSGLTSLDLSNFDTSNVTNMRGMFQSCSGLATLDLSDFDTSNVTYMSYMFSGCSGLATLDLSDFVTSNVTDMSSMFRSCSKLTKIYVKDKDAFVPAAVKATDAVNGNSEYSYMFDSCGTSEFTNIADKQ